MSARIDPAELRQVVLRLKPGVVLRMYQPISEKVKLHVLIASAREAEILGALDQKVMGAIVSVATGSPLIAPRDMQLIAAGFPPSSQ